MAGIVLKQVRKVYANGHEAVRSLDLDIADGEFLVLVGPSGCGKSTTLRLIAGLEDATSGEISIGGRVVNDVAPKDRDIAMVFQNYALYPHMTVRENMAFALKLRKVPRPEIERRVGDAARLLGIEDLLSRRPAVLSGGQRQRVAVGRAIVREPRAFLFDEPLSNLDARLRVTMRAELKALHQRLRTTTVYVTHDQEEAMTLGDRVVVMCAGDVRQAGPPLDVYARPADRFVGGFIGTPPMNTLDGRLARADNGVWFEADGGAPRLRVGDERADFGPAREVTVGVRPQAISDRVGEADRAGGRAISAVVGVVEPLGETMDVTCRLPGDRAIVARIGARDGVRPGQTIELAVEPGRVHIFERGEFGRTIGVG